MFNRAGAVPRSTLYLAVILLTSAAILFLVRRGDDGPDNALGGPVFSMPAGEVQSILLTKGRTQNRLERRPDGVWILTGAYEDYLDQDAVGRFLDEVTAATAGRLLPGTEPEDRRYGFNAAAAVRLTLVGTDKTTESLAIGSPNPVTNSHFASGAGRDACFPVAPGFYQRLIAAPLALLQQSLLPRFAVADVDSLDLWRGRTRHLFLRRDGRWWLALNPGDETRLGPLFRDLNARYPDRVVNADGRRLALADDAAVFQLIHDVSRVKATQVLTGEHGAEARDRYGFESPWRRVVLHGPGLDPDPQPGSADRLEIMFGQRETAEDIPVVRHGGMVLLTSIEAIHTLEKPLSDLLDLGAMPLLLAKGDTLTVAQDGGVILAGHRDPSVGPFAPGMRIRSSDQWFTDYPPHLTEVYDADQWHRMVRSLLLNLDRTPILAVLPPTADAAVLEDRERLTLTVVFNGNDGPGAAPGILELEMGYLDDARLPAGGPPLVDDADGLPPVGLWTPATGQLLQVPGHTIVSARTWRR